MFVLKSLGRMLGGDSPSPDVIEIPNGILYLVRPSSPKGYSECIFKDAVATIRRTSTQYSYQLIIQRTYEEGEEQLEEEEDDGFSQEGDLDEKSFLLDRVLQFRMSIVNGIPVIAWNDLYGDDNDVYEFVCNEESMLPLARNFETIALKCIFERENRKSSENIREDTLNDYRSSEAIPPLNLTAISRSSSVSQPAGADNISPPTQNLNRRQLIPEKDVPTSSSEGKSAQPLKSFKKLCQIPAELHLYDVVESAFMIQDSSVIVEVLDCSDFEYLLHIYSSTDDHRWITQKVESEMNPVFSFQHSSFIWNFYNPEGSVFSWLLRFKDLKTLEDFQQAIMKALWEHLNGQRWTKVKNDDQDYVLEAFGDADVDMADIDDTEDTSDAEYADASMSLHWNSTTNDFGEADADIASEAGTQGSSENENSQLATGRATDRTFVLRGNRIGVFKQTEGRKLEFVTTIDKVLDTEGQKFDPSRILLHESDRTMVLQNPGDPHSLYRMDLERGQVVENWKLDDNVQLRSFAPNSKYAQSTDEKTLVGTSHNALFRIDPRLSGKKLVQGEFKQYVAKNDFSAVCTTENGWIAVASNKGDIRMFDRIGINAKTSLPALGEPIIGVDVTADGRWVLATCSTYLLLIDTMIKDGKYKGQTGFERSFKREKKPAPRRLQLNPRHIAMLQGEFKREQLMFMPAHFNAGPDVAEDLIVTSVGPFLITWDFDKVKKGKLDAYRIKRYEATVKANELLFNQDKNVVVALPNDVNLIDQSSLRKATRQSLSTPIKNLRGSHSAIVNSPY